MSYCDLHTHSTASDGTTPPEDLPRLARQAGLQALALTDHHTTAGLEACAAAARSEGIAFVPGVEIAADPAVALGLPGTKPSDPPRRLGTLDILGLFIRGEDPLVLAIHQRLQDARANRNPRIIRNLQELGVAIEYEEVLQLARQRGSEVVGRPHIAEVLVRKSYAKSVQDAFNRYIAEGAPAYARKDLVTHHEALDAIHHAGGLAVLAHPVQLRLADLAELEHLVSRLCSAGLDGIETRHYDHTPAEVERFERLAEQLHLLTSGGSDFHGARKPVALGSQSVPLAVYERLHAVWKRRRGGEEERRARSEERGAGSAERGV